MSIVYLTLYCNLYMLFCIIVIVCVCVSQSNFVESVLFFPFYVCPWDHTQVTRLARPVPFPAEQTCSSQPGLTGAQLQLSTSAIFRVYTLDDIFLLNRAIVPNAQYTL